MTTTDDKIGRVLNEFKNGTLKDPEGNPVTSHTQALAIALSEAGVSKKSLQKSEIINLLKAQKAQLDSLIANEEANLKNIQNEIIKYFKSYSSGSQKDIYSFAKSLNLSPEEFTVQLGQLFSDIIKNKRH